MDRGKGCKICLANGSSVSPEECIGCSGEVPCNNDYFPDEYNFDGTLKQKDEVRGISDWSHPL